MRSFQLSCQYTYESPGRGTLKESAILVEYINGYPILYNCHTHLIHYATVQDAQLLNEDLLWNPSWSASMDGLSDASRILGIPADDTTWAIPVYTDR